MADLCTFDSTLTMFDSTLRTFDQTTCSGEAAPDVPGEQPAGGTRKRRRREQYRIRYNGREYTLDTLAEVEALVRQIRSQVSAQEMTPKEQRRKAKRAVAQIEVIGRAALQQELYRHDMPDITPMLEEFDFEGLQVVMERLEMIRAQIEAEDDDEEALLLA